MGQLKNDGMTSFQPKPVTKSFNDVYIIIIIPLIYTVENPSWFNSVSSALSSNDHIFASGVAIKGANGWWALHHWEPPIPSRKLVNKVALTYATFKGEEIILSSDSDVEDKEKEDINVLESHSEAETEKMIIVESKPLYEDLIVDESDENEGIDGKEMETEPSTTITTTAANHNSSESAIIGPVVPSADLKQQLLERLLMMDSSLLQNAIKKAKAKKMAEIEGTGGPKKKTKTEEPPVEMTETTASTATNNIPTFTLPSECLQSLEEMSTAQTKRLTAFPVIRASPYENDLLKKSNRVDYQSFKTAARLRRKLLVRRQRRKVNLALFDLDNWMYLFLKTPESALLIETNESKEVSKDNASLSNPNLVFSNSFDPQSIPFIADPTRSLYVKLTGLSAIYGTCPYPVTSPFTGKLLPEFICEDMEMMDIPKLKLLNHIKSFGHEIEDDIDKSSLLRPSNCSNTDVPTHSTLTIKYTNLRKEFVGQLNDLLSDSFWPGIDVSEALEYPDYAILALVGLSVIGCAICNPDGYLSYLYVRPDFQGYNLSTKLLSILLPLLAPKKDITLHVSVANTPAMMLYQRIGFKPEEFVVNFYDKYMGVERDGISDKLGLDNKNAFFMRLKR